MKHNWFQLLEALNRGGNACLFSMKLDAHRLELNARDLQFARNGREPLGFAAKKQVGGLRIELDGRLNNAHGAVEWIVWLENCGTENTPTLSEICAADVALSVQKDEAIRYSGLLGDDCSGDSFLPFEHALTPGDHRQVTPSGGRSSCGAFPYFDLSDADGGLIVAIGWSGQWRYTLHRDDSALHLTIGLEDACFYLKPGERVRLPRVLLKAFDGDATQGHNNYRALLREHYSPRTPDGKLVALPTAIQCFDRYTWAEPRWNTEEGQKKCVDCAARMKHIDTVWLDAAWFRGGFPYGVGNYSFRDGFPNGLKPVSDYAHKKGMKFMVWFEPERVARDTEMDKAHSDWVIYKRGTAEWGWVPPGEDASIVRPSGLMDLSRPEVVDFLIEKLSAMIRDNGIDIYRQDFNIDPLPFWRQKDEPGRSGLTEIGHIMGLYRLWDELRARFPGLVIDNCASGGRRIDLEACMRSVPLWRSDTGCSPLSDDRPSDLWNQNQSLGLSRYVVFHAVASWNWNAYEFRSAATAGIAANFDVFNPDFDFEAAEKCLAGYARLKPYWVGDFYPMTRATLEDDGWSAFQFHRADLDAGIAMLFRRASSPYASAAFRLQGVDPSARYRLTLSDEECSETVAEADGAALREGWLFELPRPRTSLAVEYVRIGEVKA